MDYSCAEFGDFGLSRFGFIVRTDTQTDRQTDRHTDRQTDIQTDTQRRMIAILTQLLYIPSAPTPTPCIGLNKYNGVHRFLFFLHIFYLVYFLTIFATLAILGGRPRAFELFLFGMSFWLFWG